MFEVLRFSASRITLCFVMVDISTCHCVPMVYVLLVVKVHC